MEVPPASAILALASAFCFGLQAIVIKSGMNRANEQTGKEPALAASFVTIVISAVIFWGLSIANGLPEKAVTITDLLPFAIVGVAYPALYRYLYFEGINRVGASIAAAISAANPAVAAVLSIILLGDRATPGVWLGLTLIVVGGITLQYTRDAAHDTAGRSLDAVVAEFATAGPRDLLYPVTGMVVLGGAYVLIKFGLNKFPYPVLATAITQTSAFAVFSVGLLFHGRVRKGVRIAIIRADVLVAFGVAGVLAALGWLGQFFALSLGTVVVVVPLISTYPLFVALLSYGLARERPQSVLALLAIALIVFGATLLQVV